MSDSELQVERGGYTTLPDTVWSYRGPDGKPLSARAVGILVLMLSKPPAWRFSTDRLAGEVREGRDAVRAAVQELEDAGFVSRRQVPDGGLFKTVTKVAPTPRYKATTAVINNGKSVVGGPVVGGSGASVTTESQDREADSPSVTGAGRRDQAQAILDTVVEKQAAPAVRSGWPARSRRRTAQPKPKDELRAAGVGTDDDDKPAPKPAHLLTQRFKALCVEHKAKPGAWRIVALNTAFKRFLDEGASVAAIERAMDDFFADTARLHRAGGVPWEDFVHQLPRSLGKAEILAADHTVEEWLGVKPQGERRTMTDEEKRKWLGA